MEKRILIFLMILLINLSILFGTILLKYFGFNILNLKFFFPGTILNREVIDIISIKANKNNEIYSNKAAQL